MAELKNGTNYCECTACGLFFGGVSTFDQHRVFMDKDAKGKYIEDWERRRCLTVAEMEAKGWRPDENGFWGRPYKAKQQPDKAA